MRFNGFGPGRLSSIAQSRVPGGNAMAEKRADFQYNRLGQFLAIDHYAYANRSATVIESVHHNNALNRLVYLSHTRGPRGERG